MQKAKPVDPGIVFAVLALLGIGLVMVFSASSVKAQVLYGSSYYFLERQAIWAALGVAVMLFVSNIHYGFWRRSCRPIFAMNLAMLVLVLIPGVGRVVNGARRWIGVGSLAVQPSEFMKFAFVLFLAWSLSRAHGQIGEFWRGLVPRLVLLGIVFGLIMLEPDMGTSLATAGTVVVMLFAAGARVWHIVGLGASALPLLGIMVWMAPYRLKRITSFLNPFADPLDSGFHIIQGLYALGSGGLFGVGLGRSRQKFFYLPEQHTDFIFAIIGEELGYLGGIVIIALFALLAWRGLMIAAKASDSFAAILAVGITTMIVLQAVINIGVVTASMPITGIPLPFLSYGGSSLLPTMAGIGILLNISKYAER